MCRMPFTSISNITNVYGTITNIDKDLNVYLLSYNSGNGLNVCCSGKSIAEYFI